MACFYYQYVEIKFDEN